MGKTKKDIIKEIFLICKEKNDFIFDNKLVKEILRKFRLNTNPYDITKLDNIEKFPEILKKEDYCIIHLGGGKHQFIKGINNIYHKFEKINKDEIIKWPYRPSILNDFSVSESSVLSLCFNHRIIHDFLYHDIVANPKVYNSERKNKVSFDYKIGNVSMKFENLQIEIDLTIEHNGYVTIFEGKNAINSNRWLDNFNIFQLYNAFRYYFEIKKTKKIDIKKITACYLIRQKRNKDSVVRLYNYTFENPVDIATIKLLKKREYILEKRDFDE